MHQVLLKPKSGDVNVVDLPAPEVRHGHVLIASQASLISAGTERSTQRLAQKSLLGKARARPDHVRRVLEKVRHEGVLTTARQVFAKLDEPMPMGYSSAGIVLACGEGVTEFKPGDRVASNGPHAEVCCVPKHLCAKVPDDVPWENAAFAVLGAIALQGVRLSKLALGETAFVIGLGLVGQITVSLLKAAGVRVFGTDLDPAKCELAVKMGAEVARPGLNASEIQTRTNELGADAVLITASTSSSGPVELAANAVRAKGRVVAVGDVGLELPRRPFYFKEAELVVSCSYGPGRYDPKYEEQGIDYPAAHVRWTEQRNIQAVLDLMSSRGLNLEPLVSHRYPIASAEKAYAMIEAGDEPYLGIVLQYPQPDPAALQRSIRLQKDTSATKRTASDLAVRIGCLGAGNFASMVLLPALKQVKNVCLETICSSGGVSANHVGRRFGFHDIASSESHVLDNEQVDAVMILTRHNDHARQVIGALQKGKHVFVEKPLCLNLHELAEIESTLDERKRDPRILMVGFNRRFAPATKALRQAFEGIQAPLNVAIRFNAGAVPADHWVQDPAVGGGRIIGEACHAIDLASYLVGSPPVRVFAESVGGEHAGAVTDDQCFITLRHANGSVSSVAYLAGGDRGFPKERVEVFGGGCVGLIDDFRRAEFWRGGRRKVLYKGRQDKGHRAELEAFAAAAAGRATPPLSWQEMQDVTVASFQAVRSLRSGTPEKVEIPLHLPSNVPLRSAG